MGSPRWLYGGGGEQSWEYFLRETETAIGPQQAMACRPEADIWASLHKLNTDLHELKATLKYLLALARHEVPLHEASDMLVK